MKNFHKKNDLSIKNQLVTIFYQKKNSRYFSQCPKIVFAGAKRLDDICSVFKDMFMGLFFCCRQRAVVY